jgi:outer membrane lipase/esterase
LNLIGDRVAANLSAFGLISAGACPIACVTTDPSLLSRYLFYVDQVHLTSRGFEIVGQYAVRQLEAPLHFEGQGEAGLQAATSFGSHMLGRLDLSSTRFGSGPFGLNFYVSGNAATSERQRTLTSLSYDLDTTGASAGVEYGGAGFVVGAAINYAHSSADMGTASGGTNADGWQGGVYAGWAGGGAFVQGYAGVGRLSYEIDRDAVIDGISADPDGDTVTAGAQAGYLMGVGALRIGPVFGLRYARADVDAFTETGDPVLTLNVSEQSLDTFTGSAGIEARGDHQLGGLSVQPYLAAALEREFQGDARTVRYSGTASPEIVNTWQVPARSHDMYGRLTGGLNLSLSGSIALQVQATTTLEQDDGDDFAGSLALRIGF